MASRPRPTLADVARIAAVSPATVSRALSRPDLVDTDTRTRILRCAAEVGYIPAGAARALVSGRSMTIGAVVPTLDHAIFAKAIQAMQTRLAAAGYYLILAAHEYSPAEERRALEGLLSRGVDGLVLVGADRAAETKAFLAACGVPVVLLWSFDESFDGIGFDNKRAGRLAAEHLLDLGHRRFGVISGILRNNDRAQLRIAGIRKALGERNIELPAAHLVETHFSFIGGSAGFTQLAKLAQPPSALICGNDILAAGALLAARSQGMQVPRDISIIGIDDLEISSQLDPPLTTIHLPTVELGQQAADHLLARIARRERPRHTVLQIALVARASTGVAPG